MTFDNDDFSDEEDRFDDVYNLLQKELGEPDKLQHGGFRFGQRGGQTFTLKKLIHGSELSFSYM